MTKTKAIFAGVLVLVGISGILIAAQLFQLETRAPIALTEIESPNNPVLIDTALWQDSILSKLARCESGDNMMAINLRDRDGTPSFGLFQFKPSTFRFYGAKYKILSAEISEDDLMRLIFSRETQEIIVRKMIADPAVAKHKEFPICWKKIGNS